MSQRGLLSGSSAARANLFELGHSLVDARVDPKHEEPAELLEWVGGQYDAEEFDPADVVFDDPKQRLEFMLG